MAPRSELAQASRRAVGEEAARIEPPRAASPPDVIDPTHTRTRSFRRSQERRLSALMHALIVPGAFRAVLFTKGDPLILFAVRWLRGAAPVLALSLAAAGAAQVPAVVVELEGGAAWQSHNDVEIPNDGSATRFSLFDLAGAGPWPASRLYLTWNPGQRHGLRLLLAPLSLTGTGVASRPISFAGASYAAGAPLKATYTFNSYRLSYRYRWHEGDRSTAWVGLTAKIRDAVIALEQGGVSSRKDDLGFVPLLHLAGEWRPAGKWRLGVDVDGLAGGPGRAVDAALKAGYDIAEAWTLQAGYRTVEGGADVPEVYTFAWFHYAAVSLVWRW